MEPDESWTLNAAVKHERSPSLDDVHDDPSSKRQADDVSGVVRDPVEFLWKECEDLDDVERLKIKEKAVIQAEKYCQRIRAVLDPIVSATNDRTEAIMMGLRIVEHWCTEHDQARAKHKDRQILVGVEGPTGAGKSSFLGSLLKYPELFPSGQESAATAVIGKASWNWDGTPGYEFRARVTFREKNEILEEVRQLLKDLNRWLRLQAGQPDDSNDYDGQDAANADAIAICRTAIDHQLPRVHAVWGLKEKDLLRLAKRCPKPMNYKDAAQTVFPKNTMATKFLNDGKAEFNASTAEMLSEAIKPFLDSSTSSFGGQKEFSAWPLVKGVHIYAKADILKPGITLVDLPGCGDAISSRSEIAEKVSHTLDVRMVVSPIIRATDEKQGQALMQNGFDEAQMMIRGKMDHRGFCVIASKMDDMKVDSYIIGTPELARNPEVIEKKGRFEELKDEKSSLKTERRDAKKAIKEAESQKKKASKAYRNAKKQYALKVQNNPYESKAHVTALKAERDARAQALMDANKHVEQCRIRKTQIAKEMKYIRDWIAHRAIQTRNTRVMKRLRDNFALRQSGLGHSEQPHLDPDYVLPILPVSTRAFWQLENDEPHMAGFPDQLYTGVPAAEQWLHKATLLKRERHLDETLDEYQSLMTMMRLYSATNGQDGNFNFTRCEVEGALADTHAFYTQKLGSKLAEACDAINKLDPLEYKEIAKRRFLHEANRIVQKWNYKYPDSENDIQRMHHSAYAANIRRDGSEYKSPGTGVTYTWIENLAAPILKTLSRDWDEKMNKRLPLIRGPMMADYSRLFTEYLDTIQHVINERVPSLGASFATMRSILENSQRATEIRIDAVLSQLAERTAGVTINAVQGLQADWKPTFADAMDKKGTGSTVKRVAIIQRRINEDIHPMCEEMINRLANGISGRQAEVPSQLRDAAAEGPRQVQQQLSVLVNNLVENLATDPAIKPKKDGLQEDVRVIIEAWEEAWIEEGVYKEHILDWDLEIPDTIPEPVFEDATKSDDDDATDDDTFDEDDDED